MRKSVIAVAVAAVLWTPEASGQTILQKTDWRSKPFETYPPPPISVPGLDVDIRTKPPKRHLPTDWQAPGRLSFQVNSSGARVTSTAALTWAEWRQG
jgi:hypothetical protein